MKIVCIDTEFTGEHALATLVSIGLVAVDGRELYVTLNDYDERQVTDWFRENVLSMIKKETSVSKKEAYEIINKWLIDYADGDEINLVSAGKGLDITLLWELYHQGHPELDYFHCLNYLPFYMNHSRHFDLNTLLFTVGFDLDQGKDAFLGREVSQKRHNALYDARVVKDCFLKLLEYSEVKAFLGKK